MPEVRARLLRPAVPASTLELWRPNAAMQAMFCGQPAGDVLELLRPALNGDVLANEPDSLLNSVATLVLIQGDELETACASCTALIDLARPRGWRIALAHGSFLRAIALVRAGRIREAEADARLSFEFKRGFSPPPALLWSLYPLVDALTELDEPAGADAALASVGLGDPPAGALASPLLLQSRARLRLAQHRPADAHADLCGAAARWEEFGIRHPGFASWRVDAAEALVALGETGDARRHADEHIALAERLGLPGPLGAGLRARAGTADGDERIALLERAVDPARGLPDPARARACARRLRRRAAPRQPPRRRSRAAAPGARSRRARRDAAARPPRARRAACHGRPPAPRSAHRAARADRRLASRRALRRRRQLKPRDRRSSSTSPSAPSRRTSRTRSRSSTSMLAPNWLEHWRRVTAPLARPRWLEPEPAAHWGRRIGCSQGSEERPFRRALRRRVAARLTSREHLVPSAARRTAN